MKKNLKMHPGFTLAELLISLLTVSLIATALVPIIGPRKITNPDPKYLHGVAECYWDNGTLMYYYADNKANRDAVAEPSENQEYCTFEPPKSGHIEVFAIGAGSNGIGTDGSDLNIEIDDSTPTFEGDIGIADFQNDINRIRDIVGDKRDVLVEGRNFDEVVRESFTKWAILMNYNYFNHANGTLHDVGGIEVNDADYPYNPNGLYLYAEFKGLRGPIGKAGNGFSEARVVPGVEYPHPDDTCEMRCTNFSNPKCTLQKKLYGNNAPWWRGANYINVNGEGTNDNNEAAFTAQLWGNCYYYLNYIGGNSAEPIRVKDADTPILFPIDGTSQISMNAGSPMRDNGNNTNYNPESGISYLTIGITARGTIGQNQINLGSSAPGKNATNTSDGRSLSNGNTGTYAYCSLFSFGSNKPKYDVNGTDLNCNSHFAKTDVNPDGVRDGMKHGLLYGLGGVLEPSIKGMQGNLGIVRPNNAFTWRFYEPVVKIKYGRAGTPGEMKSLSFARLSSPLRLRPGRRNENGDVTDTAVISSSNGADRVLMQAMSREDDVDGMSNDSYTINEVDNAATPPKWILNLAIPQNWKFANYVNKVQGLSAHGIRGGIYQSCIEGGSCPGFGGAGAYPLLINQNYSNFLEIINNQPYANSPGYFDFKTYRRTFEPKDTQVPNCSGNYTNPHAGEEDFDGLQYCTSENDIRRDGAVIIVW